MKKTIYRNGKGNYMGLHATGELKVTDIKSAYTTQALINCGLVRLQGKQYKATGKAIDKAMLTGIMGNSAVGHWLNTRGWLQTTADGIKATADGIKALNNRYAGTGPTYNVSLAALRIVGHAMRTGEDSGIGYNGQPFTIES